MASSGVFSRALFPSRKRQMSTRFSAWWSSFFSFFLLCTSEIIRSRQSRANSYKMLEDDWNVNGILDPRAISYKFANGSTRSLQQVSAYCVRRPIISLRQHFHDGTRAVFPCYIAYMSQSCEFHACLKLLLYKTIHTQRNRSTCCRRAIHNQTHTTISHLFQITRSFDSSVCQCSLLYNTRWIKHTLCVGYCSTCERISGKMNSRL